jgi:hypothetical protein
MALAGDGAGARQTLAALDAHGRERYVTPIDEAIVRIGLGERDAALDALAAAHEARDTWVPWLQCWALFDPLRDHRRFAALVPNPA